jgi:RNA polymerase sigma factor (sigma-70 family)
LHLANALIIKGKIYSPENLIRRGGGLVPKNLSDKEKEIICRKFDSYCKKILKHAAIDYDRRINHISKHEISIDGIPENTPDLFHKDEYFQKAVIYKLSSGGSITVKGDIIVQMINVLPLKKREIILLSYFTDMTDAEICAALDITRGILQYQRKTALEYLKKIFKEN